MWQRRTRPLGSACPCTKRILNDRLGRVLLQLLRDPMDHDGRIGLAFRPEAIRHAGVAADVGRPGPRVSWPMNPEDHRRCASERACRCLSGTGIQEGRWARRHLHVPSWDHHRIGAVMTPNWDGEDCQCVRVVAAPLPPYGRLSVGAPSADAAAAFLKRAVAVAAVVADCRHSRA